MDNNAPLQSHVGEDGPNFPDDSRLIQSALYLARDPDNRPYYMGRRDARFGPQSQEALNRFLSDQNLDGSRTLSNGSDGLLRLAQAANKNIPKDVNTPPVQLKFDGKSFCWTTGPYAGVCRSAVSGRPGYQSPKYQGTVDKGPLPEGRWRARQDRHQRFEDVPVWGKIKSYVGGGPWPGATRSWGENRIWLEPLEGTDVKGRSNFGIHGGTVPGSAGCIDLTEKMKDFTKEFKNIGKDVEIIVDYSNWTDEAKSSDDEP